MIAAGTNTAFGEMTPASDAQQDRDCLLLRFPSQLLERIVLMAGAGGAGACYSCRTLAEAWRSVATPYGAARYLEARWVEYPFTCTSTTYCYGRFLMVKQFPAQGATQQGKGRLQYCIGAGRWAHPHKPPLPLATCQVWPTRCRTARVRLPGAAQGRDTWRAAARARRAGAGRAVRAAGRRLRRRRSN